MALPHTIFCFNNAIIRSNSKLSHTYHVAYQNLQRSATKPITKDLGQLNGYIKRKRPKTSPKHYLIKKVIFEGFLDITHHISTQLPWFFFHWVSGTLLQILICNMIGLWQFWIFGFWNLDCSNRKRRGTRPIWDIKLIF